MRFVKTLALVVFVLVVGVADPHAQQRLKTGVFTANPTMVLGNTTLTLPDPAGNQLRVPVGIVSLETSLNLSLSDKLSDGLSITFGVYFSTDNGQTWQFANGFVWNSYGPGGLTVTDPDGTVRVNPDPRLHTNISERAGQLVRAVALTNRTVSAGLTVSVF